MKNKKWILTLLVGLIAAGGHFTYVRGLATHATGGDKISVLSYAAPLRTGEKLTRDKLAKRSVPISYVDNRVVREEKADDVIGLVAAVDVAAGEVIQWSDFILRQNAHAADLSDLLASGERAMTIPVDRSLSMGGLLRPGHRVDILGTFGQQENRRDRITVTLLQNVRVLAVGKRLNAEGYATTRKEPKRSDTVTLSVGLEEAELLALSTKQGTLSLALRGRQDLRVVQGVPEVGMADVWESERRQALQRKAVSKATTIERIQAR
jgi:pilus assembly protein CpaB